MQYDVVIVGAGPIGLSHAWGIKAINPDLNVLVIEKYTEYQRKHTLYMQTNRLKALMKITKTTDNPILSNLYHNLQHDAHIRTTTLEEAFKSAALSLGVIIEYQTITADNIFDDLIKKHPMARLIIGADGTHSQVNRTFFSKENQIKHEIDYVLQLRYEGTGASRQAINTMPFLQMMIQHEIIANEYVGHFDQTTNSVPITMQAMITKDEFTALKLATSKDPIRLYHTDDNQAQLPSNLSTFINTYLEHKTNQGLEINYSSVRVSVNEAPATRASQVYTMYENRIILLAGDAGLGLSYFKGLNAGLESTGQLLSELKPWLLNNSAAEESLLHNYQTWFNTFADNKIKEVKNYSSQNIHVPWTAIRFIHSVVETSYASSVSCSRFIEDTSESSISLSDTTSSWLGNIWTMFKSPVSSRETEERDQHLHFK